MRSRRVGLARPAELGVILLGIWLIVTALLYFIKVSIPGQGIILGLIALVAGILLLSARGGVSLPFTGSILLAIWLIIEGALTLLGISFPGLALVMALLALAAGVLLLLRR